MKITYLLWRAATIWWKTAGRWWRVLKHFSFQFFCWRWKEQQKTTYADFKRNNDAAKIWSILIWLYKPGRVNDQFLYDSPVKWRWCTNDGAIRKRGVCTQVRLVHYHRLKNPWLHWAKMINIKYIVPERDIELPRSFKPSNLCNIPFLLEVVLGSAVYDPRW